MDDLKYRPAEYFNHESLYLFDDGYKLFESKVEYSKGDWWTLESLKYKATSIKCKKLPNN